MITRNECLPGVPQPSRLGAVWLSFRTNWTAWSIPLFLLVLFAPPATFALLDYHKLSTVLPFGLKAPPSLPFPEPAEEIKDSHQDPDRRSSKTDHHRHQIDWANLKSLTTDSLYRYPEILTPGAIPRLETLKLNTFISDAELIKICELYDLKSLFLFDDRLTPASWSVLARETSLENLELFDVDIQPIPGMVERNSVLKDEISLDWPRNLRTLHCEDHRGISLLRLDEWQQLPGLQSLSTTFVPEDEQAARETIDFLQAFPSLKTVYAMVLKPWYSDNELMYESALARLKVAAKENPSFSARIYTYKGMHTSPLDYERARVAIAMMILGLGFCVVLALAFQMSAVFIASNSVLFPGFAGSNIVPVIVIGSIVPVMSFALLRWLDCTIAASMGLCVAPILVCALFVTSARWFARLSGVPLPGLNQSGLVSPALSLFSPAIVGFNRISSTIDLFLDGSYSWVAWMLLIGSLWGAYDLIVWHIRLRRDLEEAGAGDITFSMFNSNGLKQWMTQVAALRSQDRRRVQGFARINEAHLASRDLRFEQQMETRHRDSQQLWRICHATPQFTLFLWIGMLSVIVLAVVFPEYSEPNSLRMMAGFIPLGIIILFGRLWQLRCWHEMELLRPITRRVWAWSWFRGFAAQAAPILFAPIGMGVIMRFSGRFPDWSATELLLLVGFQFAVASAGIAIGFWTMTLRQKPAMLVLAAAGIVCSLLHVLSFLYLLRDSLLKEQPATMVGPIAVGLLAIAALFLGLAWQRWCHWEVGRGSN